MVRSERFPARGCRSNERATGSGPACPYFRKLSSKTLLCRCAVSSAGCYGQVTAVADRGVLGAVNAPGRRPQRPLHPCPGKADLIDGLIDQVYAGLTLKAGPSGDW